METFLGWSEQNEEDTFKSYYVVWKLSIKGKAYTMSRRFKSYYVVWKRGFFASIPAPNKSLNRTM